MQEVVAVLQPEEMKILHRLASSAALTSPMRNSSRGQSPSSPVRKVRDISTDLMKAAGEVSTRLLNTMLLSLMGRRASHCW